MTTPGTKLDTFWDKEGKLDKRYLRVSAVYKLLRRRSITEDYAVTALNARRIDGKTMLKLWRPHLERAWEEDRAGQPLLHMPT